jgi:hypothetical protein
MNGSRPSPLFPAWFLSRRICSKVRTLIPSVYRARLRVHFELYGCLRCGRKNREYFSNGLCCPCSIRMTEQLARCDRILAKRSAEAVSPIPNEMVKRVADARSILADLRRSRYCGKKTRREAGAPTPLMLSVRSGKEPPGLRWA